MQHLYYHQIMLNHSKNELFLPTLERSSMYYNLRSIARKFTKIMHRIQERMRDSMQANRAKMNYLQITFDKQKEKLMFQYIQKNKKKEFT